MARLEDLALIMKITPYRESSAMLSMFSQHHGRLTAVQKGFRRRKYSQPLSPFTLVEATLVGRGSLLTLAGCEVVERIELHGDALASGFYVFELLSRGVGEQQVEERLFREAVLCLERLRSGNLAASLRRFERALLDDLGYGIDFERAAGLPIDATKSYSFVAEMGFVESESQRDTFSGQVLLDIGRGHYTDALVLSVAREIYQRALSPIVGEQPLVSRTLLSPRGQSRGA